MLFMLELRNFKTKTPTMWRFKQVFDFRYLRQNSHMNMQSRLVNCSGYGEKYQGWMRDLPNSIHSTFLILVIASSLCPTIDIDPRRLGVDPLVTAGIGWFWSAGSCLISSIGTSGIFRFRPVLFASASLESRLKHVKTVTDSWLKHGMTHFSSFKCAPFFPPFCGIRSVETSSISAWTHSSSLLLQST